jgi:transposase
MSKTKNPRKQHGDEFKAEALNLANQVGAAQAARDLGVHASQIYQWRTAAEKKANSSAREGTLATEVAKLKRQLAEQTEEISILKKAATYFAKNQK